MSPKRIPIPFEPKRYPVQSSIERRPVKRPAKWPPPKHVSVLDSIPEPATLRRIQEAAAPKIRSEENQHSQPPPKPKELKTKEDKTGLFRYLRFCAGMYYTTDLRGCTIDHLGRHPMFKIVATDTLARWSIEDRWVERRQLNLEQWRQAIEHKIGSELVQARKTGLEKLEIIFEKVFNKLDEDIVQAKSYEGLVAAFVKLADLMDNWNDRIAKAIIPDMPTTGVTSGPSEQARPRLTQTEAREAAKLILTIRRDEMRGKARLEKSGQELPIKPELTVVDGDR